MPYNLHCSIFQRQILSVRIFRPAYSIHFLQAHLPLFSLIMEASDSLIQRLDYGNDRRRSTARKEQTQFRIKACTQNLMRCNNVYSATFLTTLLTQDGKHHPACGPQVEGLVRSKCPTRMDLCHVDRIWRKRRQRGVRIRLNFKRISVPRGGRVVVCGRRRTP